MGIVGTVSSWFLMRYIGRRALYFWGLLVLLVLLTLIGVMGCLSGSGPQYVLFLSPFSATRSCRTVCRRPRVLWTGWVADRTTFERRWAVGALLLVYTFGYDATVGPVCYTLVSVRPWPSLPPPRSVRAPFGRFWRLFAPPPPPAPPPLPCPSVQALDHFIDTTSVYLVRRRSLRPACGRRPSCEWLQIALRPLWHRR